MKKALETNMHPTTGAHLHGKTKNKIQKYFETLTEMKEKLETGIDPITQVKLTKMELNILKQKMKSLQCKLLKEQAKKDSKELNTVLNNCKNQNLDEYTREKILEAANMHNKSSKMDLFTMLWAHLELYNKIEVLNYLKKQNFSNHNLLRDLKSNIDDNFPSEVMNEQKKVYDLDYILRAANLHVKGPLDTFPPIWNSLNTASKTIVRYFLEKEGAYKTHI